MVVELMEKQKSKFLKKATPPWEFSHLRRIKVPFSVFFILDMREDFQIDHLCIQETYSVRGLLQYHDYDVLMNGSHPNL